MKVIVSPVRDQLPSSTVLFKIMQSRPARLNDIRKAVAKSSFRASFKTFDQCRT